MSKYIDLVTEAINYIEDNIYEQMTASDIAGHLYVSEYHFSRLFRFLIGMSPVRYLSGRKLTHSLSMLSDNSVNISDIALSYGYGYPEVYSRAFKKYFGISPGIVRKDRIDIVGQGVADVISRDVITLNGNVTLRSDYVYIETARYCGYSDIIDITSNDAPKNLQRLSERFLRDAKESIVLDDAHYINVVKCMGNGRDFDVFACMKKNIDNEHDASSLDTFEQRIYEGSWYVKFFYEGDINKIEPSLEQDILSWIKQRKEPLEMVEPGLFLDFGNGYEKDSEIGIMVRIKRMETEDERHT